MRVYLAGPMTGLPLDNYPAFRAAAKRLRAAGYKVSNPAENPKPVCGTWLGYMRMGIKQLVDCEAIVLLPGWRNSKGVSIEFPLAHGLDFPFFEMPADGADVPTPEAFRAAWFDGKSVERLREGLVAAWGGPDLREVHVPGKCIVGECGGPELQMARYEVPSAAAKHYAAQAVGLVMGEG